MQTGLGRTGEWFGFQHCGVEPDVVTMAKALGNGVPDRRVLGARRRRRGVRARRPRHDLRRPAARGRGRAAPCSTMMERDDVPALAAAGRRPAHRRRCATLPGVAEVRGLGLLLAAELDAGIDAKAGRADAASTPGSSSTRSRRRALRLAPPLLVTDDEIDEAVDDPRARCWRRRDVMTRHFLEVDDLDPGRARAGARPAPWKPIRDAAAGARRARAWPLLFEKPSARTRNSIEMAVVQLGGHPIYDPRRGGRPRRPRDASRTSPARWPATTR